VILDFWSCARYAARRSTWSFPPEQQAFTTLKPVVAFRQFASGWTGSLPRPPIPNRCPWFDDGPPRKVKGKARRLSSQSLQWLPRGELETDKIPGGLTLTDGPDGRCTYWRIARVARRDADEDGHLFQHGPYTRICLCTLCRLGTPSALNAP